MSSVTINFPGIQSAYEVGAKDGKPQLMQECLQ